MKTKKSIVVKICGVVLTLILAGTFAYGEFIEKYSSICTAYILAHYGFDPNLKDDTQEEKPIT